MECESGLGRILMFVTRSMNRLPKHLLVGPYLYYHLAYADNISTGSPNGLGAAYFLLQHKVQLGGAKSINKIKIWRTEDEDHEEPNVIFYVEDAAPEEKQVGSREAELGGLRKKDMVEDVASKIVKRSGDGKSVVREHIIRARL